MAVQRSELRDLCTPPEMAATIWFSARSRLPAILIAWRSSTPWSWGAVAPLAARKRSAVVALGRILEDRRTLLKAELLSKDEGALFHIAKAARPNQICPAPVTGRCFWSGSWRPCGGANWPL